MCVPEAGNIDGPSTFDNQPGAQHKGFGSDVPGHDLAPPASCSTPTSSRQERRPAATQEVPTSPKAEKCPHCGEVLAQRRHPGARTAGADEASRRPGGRRPHP